MNLLLIGFSEQNAKAFSMLMQLNFENITAGIIPRQFSHSLQLTLPSLSRAELRCDGFVIDLDGVGIINYDETQEKRIHEFIVEKPTLLLSRRSLEQQMHSSNSIFFLKKPYNKEQVNTIIIKIQDLVKKNKNRLDSPPDKFSKPSFLSRSNINSSVLDRKNLLKEPINQNINQYQKSINQYSKTNFNQKPVVDTSQESTPANNSTITTQATVGANTTSVVTNDEMIKKAQESSASIVWQILRQYFPNIYSNKLINHLLTVINYKSYVQVQAGKYQLVIDPSKDCVIVNTELSRIIDYCVLLKSHHNLRSKIQLQPLTATAYQEMVQHIEQAGYQKQSLTTLFWQIFDEVLDRNMEVRHSLTLKVAYVPNFTAMRFVPSYMYPVVSSCLAVPRNLEDLNRLFPELKLNQLNRAFVLCILTGISDYQLLERSKSIEPVPAKLPSETKNMGIQKANKSGFFKRLLSKLSF